MTDPPRGIGNQPVRRGQAEDRRSNAEIIQRYHEERRSIDGTLKVTKENVLRVTVHLLHQGGEFSVSMKLFDALKQAGIQPSLIAYNEMISVCAKAGQVHKALELFNEMQALGIRPDRFAYTSAISACARVGWVDVALALFHLQKAMASSVPSLQPDGKGYSAIIAACLKAERIDTALGLFDEQKAVAWDSSMRAIVVSYGLLISACRKFRRPEDTRALIKDAIARGVMTETAGYDAAKDQLDFHLPKVFRDPDRWRKENEHGVSQLVALALLDYHFDDRRIDPAKTRFAVGWHGGTQIKQAIWSALIERGYAYTTAHGNGGLLIPS